MGVRTHVDEAPALTLTSRRRRRLSLFWGNPVLVIGGLIALLMLVAAVAPGWLAPHDPEEKGSVLQEINGKWMAPPFPPGGTYLLGTDVQARDLLSRVIYGAGRTLGIALLITFVRIVIGISLGWAAARYPGEVRRYVLALASTSATVPSLLFAYLIIVTIGPYRGIPVFVISLGFTGWAPWTQLIYDGIQRIRNEQYMEAAIAIGSTPRSQLRYYLLPNLLPMLIPALAQEIAAVLLILAELGFLGIFLGTKHGITMADLLSGEQPTLPYPEWAGMLAGTRMSIFTWWWLPVVPAGAFAIAILGLSLLGEGLRDALDIRRR